MNRCLLKARLTIMGSLAALLLNAQTLLRPTDLLLSALNDPEVSDQTEQIRFQQKNAKNLPFVDVVNLRTETNRFELNRQEYLARVSVNGLLEKNRYRRLLGAQLKETLIEKEEKIQTALFDRYLVLAEYFAVLQQIQTLQQLKTVLDDKLYAQSTLAALSNLADPDDVLKTAHERDQLALDLEDQQGYVLQLLSQCQIWLPDQAATALDTTQWIRATQLYQRLIATPDTLADVMALQTQQAKIERIEAEYHFEKARSLQSLDFIQFRYGNRPEEPFRNAAAVSIGVNIPWNGTRAARQSQLSIEKNAAELEQNSLEREITQALRTEKFKLERLYRQHLLLQQQIKDYARQFEPEQASLLAKNSIVTLLQFRELQLKKQLKITALEKEITETCLNILYLSGRISGARRNNYLHTDWSAY